MKFERHIQSNFKTILRAKLYYLWRKSLWIYALFCLLVGYWYPLETFGRLCSGLLYTCSFLFIIVLPIFYFSARRLANNLSLNALIEFDENSIKLTRISTGLLEIKTWDWIKRIDIDDQHVRLTINQPSRFIIFLKNLSNEELSFFKWKRDVIQKIR